VDKRIGLPELAQDGLVYATCAEKGGRCESKNPLEALSKSGPTVYGEEKLWNGSLGRLPTSENFISLSESEQGGLSGIGKVTSHQVNARNRATSVLPSISFEVMKEKRRSTPCTAHLVAEGIADLETQISTPAEGKKGGFHGSSKSVSRVEDSLGES